jgi:TolB protein
VEGGRAQKRELSIPDFQPEDPNRPDDAKAGARIREVLRSDLLFSRYFSVVDQGGAFTLAAKAGRVQDLVTVSVKLQAASGDALFERYYRQNAQFERALAHKIADDVVRQLTGKPGVAHTRLAFINDQSGSPEIYLADYDGENAQRLTSFKALTLFPRWSPEGKRLAFTSYKGGNPDLFLLDVEKGTARPVSERQGLNIAGGFSPDGTRLAATVSQQKDPNVFLVDLGDGSLKRVTSHFGVDSSPTFSPDGEQIAFVSDRAGNPQVHVQELSTGRVKRLTRLNWCDSPAWSPSGEWIAFAGRANNKDPMDVFLVDVTGTRVIQLTHGEGSNVEPAWSPDSRFLAFTKVQGKRKRIYLMDADGSAPRAAFDLPGNSSNPSWGP